MRIEHGQPRGPKWDVCPAWVHLLSGDVLQPQNATYGYWVDADNSLLSLHWVEGPYWRDLNGRIQLSPGAFWRIVPAGAIAYMDVEP